MNKETGILIMTDILLMCVTLVVMLWLLSDNNPDEQRIDQKQYCEMVELWNDNKHLSKEDRPGWPPYKGECHEG